MTISDSFDHLESSRYVNIEIAAVYLNEEFKLLIGKLFWASLIILRIGFCRFIGDVLALTVGRLYIIYAPTVVGIDNGKYFLKIMAFLNALKRVMSLS